MTLLAPSNTVAPPPRPSSWRGRDIVLRTAEEIEAMRRAGAVVKRALQAAERVCVAGATTREVDAAAHAVIADSSASPLFLNYPYGTEAGFDGGIGSGFPAASCVSVNEEVVHGVPGDRVLADGDLVTIDCGVRLDGWCADAAVTVPVGSVDPRWMAMLETGRIVLEEAIRLATPGRRWSDVAARLESMILESGFGIVESYVGHGIGRHLHEAPEVSCVVTGDHHLGRDFTVRPGMTLAIEPILALTPGSDGRTVETHVRGDGWTVATTSGVPACHLEHTIAVTRSGTTTLTG